MLAKLNELEKTSSSLPYVYAIIGNVTLVFMQINMKIVAHTVTPFYALFLRGFLLLAINSAVVRLNHLKVDQNNK